MKIGFSYPGGKFKIHQRLFEHFPHIGDHYYEPFAGRGNIFFNFYQIACFDEYHVNDLNTGSFFTAIKNADFKNLPKTIDKMEFEKLRWKSERDDPIALALEPVITFSGRGYGNGANLGHYDRIRYLDKFKFCQGILRDPKVTITKQDWSVVPWVYLTDEDFVYCDPPYYMEDGYNYNNIDHESLLLMLKDSMCNWAISGWETELYYDMLGDPTLKFNRRKDMVAGSQQVEVEVVECLWTSSIN
jgi:site-specific DNA-adenine methylase